MYTPGIDVHKRELQVAVLDEDGEIAQEYAGADAAVKATGNYYAIYDTLDEYFNITVADPQQTKATGIAEVKNDRLDAKLLAQLRQARRFTASAPQARLAAFFGPAFLPEGARSGAKRREDTRREKRW